MSILRTAVVFVYIFGYMIVHYPTLRRAERAFAAQDMATVQALVRRHVPHWCRRILVLCGVSLTVLGAENIPAGRACVFVANHRSYFDIPVMLTCLDSPHGILAKQELQRIPLLNRWMRLVGCVFVQRDDLRASMRAVNAATQTVADGQSFIIFPEGTRYRGEEGGVGDFKQGAFHMAIKTGAPVVPVAITGTRALFEGNGHRMTPGRVTVRILPPIETAGMTKTERRELPQAVQQIIQARLT